jgi:hypothetical protein
MMVPLLIQVWGLPVATQPVHLHEPNPGIGDGPLNQDRVSSFQPVSGADLE